MSIDVLKPNKNPGLAISEPGATRIFPGGYTTSTNGASFTLKDVDNISYTIPAGTSSIFLPKGATEVSAINSPVPTSWSKFTNIPSTFGTPRAACKGVNNEFFAIDNFSNIIKSTNGTTWSSVRTGTPATEQVHFEVLAENNNASVSITYPNAQANDVSVIIIVDADGTPGAPTGYTSMGYTTVGPSMGWGTNTFYRVLPANAQPVSYSRSVAQYKIFHFIIRGISTGSAPTFSSSFQSQSTDANSWVQPAYATPQNAGAFGIAYNLYYTADSSLNTLLEGATTTSTDGDGFLTLEMEGFATATTANEFIWSLVGSKILDNNEGFISPSTPNFQINGNSWLNRVIIFEPAATVISGGFSASDIASSPSVTVATDSTFGKVLTSTNGTTWTAGTVGNPSATTPTVLWRYEASTTATQEAAAWTLPSSPALQEGDLVIVHLTNSSDRQAAITTPGWKLLAASSQPTGSFPWTDSIYYKVMGSTPDSVLNVANRNNNSGYQNMIGAIALRGASADLRFTGAESTSGVPNAAPLTMSANSRSVVLANSRTYYTPNSPAGYTTEVGYGAGITIVADKAITSTGTEDPAAFLDPNGSANGAWMAWTIEVKPKDADGIINSLVWDGTRFVGGGNGVFESTNGTTWTKLGNPVFGSRITKITYTNGVYLAGSSDGHVLRSSNATTWTTSKVSSYPIVSLAFSGVFIAVDSSGAAYTSDDAITWALRLPNGSTVRNFFTTNSTTATSVAFTASPGDIVIATYNSGSATANQRTAGGSGWVNLVTKDGGSGFPSVGTWYKVMGATPDTQFTITTALPNTEAVLIATVISNPNKAALPRFANDSGIVTEVGTSVQPAPSSVTTTVDNTLLITYIGNTGQNFTWNSYPFGLFRDVEFSQEITGFRSLINDRTLVDDGSRRYGINFVLVPSPRLVSGGTVFYGGGSNGSWSTYTIAVALKDTRPTAVEILNPNALALGRDGTSVAIGSSGVSTGPSTPDTVLGAGASFLNGRKVNVLTTGGRQFVAGNDKEIAVITSLG